MSRRPAAILAILSGSVAIAVGAYSFFDEFPRGLIVLGCIFLALGVAWFGVLRRGVLRLLASLAALVLFAVAVVALVGGENSWILAVVLVVFGVGIATARVAFKPDKTLPAAPPPRQPVLFVNPRSGDGRAAGTGQQPQGPGSDRGKWLTQIRVSRLLHAKAGTSLETVGVSGLATLEARYYFEFPTHNNGGYVNLERIRGRGAPGSAAPDPLRSA